MNNSNKYQNKFVDQKAPIDKDALWAKIANDSDFPADQEPQKRRLLLLIFLAVLSLIIFFFCWKNFISSSNSLSAQSESRTEEIARKTESSTTREMRLGSALKSDKDDVQSTVERVENVLDDLVPNQGIIKSVQLSSADKPSHEIMEVISKAQAGVSELVEQKSTVPSVSYVNDFGENYQSGINTQQTVETGKSTQELDLQKNGQHAQSQYSSKELVVSSDSNSEKAILKQIMVNDQKEQRSDEVVIDGDENVIVDSSEKAAFKLDLQTSRTIVGERGLYIEKSDLLAVRSHDLPVLNLKKDSIRTPAWLIAIGASTGTYIHDFAPENGALDPDFVHYAANSSATESQGFYVSGTRIVKKKWAVKLEFGMTDAYRRFESNTTSETIERNLNTVDGFYSRVSTTVNFKIYNKYRVVNINALIQRRYSFDRMSLHVGAGLRFSNFSTSRYTFYNEESVQRDLRDFIDYSPTMNLSGILEVELAYSLSKNIQALASVQYASRVNLAERNSSVKHRVSSIDTRLGIAYRF